MSTNPRFKALEIIQTRKPKEPIDKKELPDEIFASNVFGKKIMKHYLSQDIYEKLQKCINHGEALTREIADPVANAIKSWAMDNGATHFTHWFQPLTGLAAEKHDSFLDLSETEAIYKFSGNELVQQEPDASSFPHGGLRSTFEARGYTAWDSSSPVFIFETMYGKTLCIPTIFVSYTGEALDYKLPLLKSIALLDQAATQVCQYFNKNIHRVFPAMGAEQEYFLVDESFFFLRPDLVLTGRTVCGAPPAKGQQLEDHYFGSIPERVFAFMNQLEMETHRLGIPLKTRHNEVAPGQYECAPRYEELNVAVDHSLMLMDIIERTARQHHFRALLHEKPFEGINGSGKHNNWSIHTDTGKNLLTPGSNPRENLMFLSFFTTVIRAVYDHADLLRASVASAGNDLRLGASEAPPPIISVFIGNELSRALQEVISPPRKIKANANNPYLKLGISKIPELLLDNTDRNRTSPFAFTGNKFEFRAVGAAANSSNAMTVLNIIVADQLTRFKKKVDSKINRGRKKELAILDVIRENIKASQSIMFEGDGFSKDWVKEAKKRGLSLIDNTPDALDAYLNPSSVKLFTTLQVFTPAELQARHEVMIRNYLTKVRIEADILSELALTSIVPAAISYQRTLLQNIKAVTDLHLSPEAVEAQRNLVEEIGRCVNTIILQEKNMKAQREKLDDLPQSVKIAKGYAHKVMPLFREIRKEMDHLEVLLPDDVWPLPKYREMLLVR